MLDIRGSEEGKGHINLSSKSNCKLGKLLSLGRGFPKPIPTIIGTVGNLRSALTYIKTPSYPDNILARTKLRQKDVAYVHSLPKKRIKDFWAIFSMIVIARVFSDKEILDEIKKLGDDVWFTLYTAKEVTNGTLITPNGLLVHANILNAIKDNIHDMDEKTMMVKIPKLFSTTTDGNYFKDTHFKVI